MHRWFVKWGSWVFPILGSLALFSFMHVLQEIGGFTIPVISMVAMGLVAVIAGLGYLLRLNVLKRIGGTAVVILAVLIITGLLLPKATIGSYPKKASDAVTQDFDTAWRAVYSQDLFKEFSLYEHLMQYAESLSRFDIHRVGQMSLFGLFGIALSLCFLFPIDPSRRWK